MTRKRLFRKGAIHTLTACALAFVLVGGVTTAQAQAVRPEVGNPLKAAADLVKGKKFAEATAKLREAEAVGGKTSAENAMIEQMRGYIATSSGDTASAINSYETQINSGRLSGAEQLRAIQAVTSLYYQARNYDKAMQWAQRYIKEGGTDPQMRGLPMQLAFMSGDCQSVIKDVQGQIRADESAGRTPSEDKLQLLANCASKQKDNGTYVSTMQKLVAYYPKKEYWNDLLNRIQKKPGFSGNLAIDVYRLKFYTGNVTTADGYMELAQLELQEGQNWQAKKIVDMGFSSGVLGAGSDVNRQNRLRALVERRLADEKTQGAKLEADAIADPDGDNLSKLGQNYIGAGQTAKGIELMEQAAKKNLKRPDLVKLHQGLGYLQAGQRAKGLQILKTVKGDDGSEDIARLLPLVKIQMPEVSAPAKVEPKGKGSKK